MRFLELLGFATGAMLAPFVAVGSYLRKARLVHPDGAVFRAEVTPLASVGPEKDVADRLSGPALVRLSTALFKWKKGRENWPDLLGAAVRFTDDPIDEAAKEGDQDLLFVTAQSLLLLLPALYTTNVQNFLANDYYALSVFETEELGRVKWRLASPGLPDTGKSRVEAIEEAIAAGDAVLELQARSMKRGAQYQPIARVKLVQRLDLDQAVLRFSPFRTGRGIIPRGFLNAVRVVTYPASQLARPLRTQ